ncbi:CD63 antigen-like [Armigeres subalbatus]|uniref:CD63 antigen-like n=1 Tax=Armigeres subalbatus TaxID=124917 RepID=UPI002ED1660F
MPNLSTVKTSLIVLNTCCVICGIWLAIFSLIMMYKYSDLIHLVGRDSLPANAMKLALVLGWAMVATGFYGIHGVIRKSFSLMVLYIVLLMALITFQSAMAAVLFGRNDGVPNREMRRFERTFDQVLKSGTFSERIEQFQTDHRCCGKWSFQDWTTYGGRVPTSCCVAGLDQNCRAFVDGCLQILENYIRHTTKSLGVGLIVLATVDFVALLFASCFANGIKNESN